MANANPDLFQYVTFALAENKILLEFLDEESAEDFTAWWNTIGKYAFKEWARKVEE
jgi:hypothetical protein